MILVVFPLGRYKILFLILYLNNKVPKIKQKIKQLKEKQEQEYYKEFLDAEIKEVDDITSARFNLR